MEVTATIIPRSSALAKFNILAISTIKSRHVDRTIKTRIYYAPEKRLLLNAITRSILDDKKLLVIYPTIKSTSSVKEKQSLESAITLWEKYFPNLVGFAHGQMRDQDKNDAIEKFKVGHTQILIATTAVEVGMNVPDLNHVLIIKPEQFGLASLHQLRGRAARAGGTGYFDMLVDGDISEDSTRRLNILVKHDSGFDISKEELKLRGCGQLTRHGSEQSGLHDCLFFGFNDHLAMESLFEHDDNGVF